MSDQERFRCAIYRGGTSKALFFKENELPSESKLREKLLLGVFGSPDVRQIDGLGGSDITTSKVAIIGPPSREDAEVDYTFGQVLIDRPEVSFKGNCGNISSAVGPFAINEGLVRTKEPITTVRIHNTNTNKILLAEVPVFEGKAASDGDFEIPGVPGTGAMIRIDFADTAGSATGKLLPAGDTVNLLEVEGIGKIRASVIDAANPVVFVLARDVDATGMEDRLEINANKVLMDKLEMIRAAGAKAAGIIKDCNMALKESPLIPQVAFISPQNNYVDHSSGKKIKAEDISFLSRIVFNQMALDSYTGTGSICTAAAAMLPGTLVNEVASEATKKTGIVRIGHPRGVMEIETLVEEEGGVWRLKKAVMKRTARRLMEGYVYINKRKITG